MTVVRLLGRLTVYVGEDLSTTYATLELKVPILPTKDQRASVLSGESWLLLYEYSSHQVSNVPFAARYDE